MRSFLLTIWSMRPRSTGPKPKNSKSSHSLFACEERARSREDADQGVGTARKRSESLDDGGLARARGLRHVRCPVKESPEPQAHPASGGLGRLSVAQGLRHPAAGRGVGPKALGY